MGIKSYFSNDVETRELHRDVDLRSRYYKTSKKKIVEVINQYCNEQGLFIKSYNESLGEMYLQSSKYHVMVSVIQVTPLETSIDLKVQTYRFIGANKPRKLIIEMYQYFDSKLPFKGTGLHP